jgi:hypothetical protein
MMQQPARTLVATLLFAYVATGCAWRNVCVSTRSPPTELGNPISAGVCDRGHVTADASAVGSYEKVDAALPRPFLAGPYLKCRAEDCKCGAAAHAAVAALLDVERELAATGAQEHCGKKSCAAALAVDLLRLRARDERNRAAALALEAFYRLLDAETARDALSDSLAEVRRSLDHFAQLKSRGLHLDTDDRPLRQQQRDLLERQVELESSVVHVTGQLKLLLGIDPCDRSPIWPEADLTVAVQAIDADTAVSVGLSKRADLTILRLLVCKLDVETLPAARRALQQVDMSLGSQGAQLQAVALLLHPAESQGEVEARCRQLQRLLDERQRMAAEQILTAVTTVHAQLRQVALSKDTRDQCRLRLDQLAEKRSAGPANPSELSTARLEAIHANRDLVHQIIEWKIAQVKLKEAQGWLAVECGYGPCCCASNDDHGPRPAAPLPTKAGDPAPSAPQAPGQLPLPAGNAPGVTAD